MELIRAQTPRLISTVVKLEACSSSSSSTGSSNGALPPPQSYPLPRLSVRKPSWIVRTESNVRRERRKKPEPPCVVCSGSGRVDCHQCHGKGRTNYVDVEMLPKGEWPKWCKTCGSSGLGYCPRCLGTGEYRYIMGFQFMKREEEEINDGPDHQK